jgi:photosystem II stability/assembly factor-like uncharacterized protein
MTRRIVLAGSFIVLLLLIDTTVSRAQSWQQLPGPYGGKVTCLALGRNDVIFAGTEHGGVIRKISASEDWQYRALGGQDVRSLVVTPNGDLYAGTGTEVHYSTDDGATWTSNPLPQDQTAAALLADNAGTVYVAGLTGIHRSSDRGGTWTAVNGTMSNLMTISLARGISGTLLAGFYYGGLFRSTDEGATWTRTGSDFESMSVPGIFVHDGGAMYAAATGMGIYSSTDDGVTWTAVVNGLDKLDVSAVFGTFAGTLFTGTATGRIYRSSDNGAQWTQVFTMPRGETVLSFIEAGDGTIYAGTQWGGAFSSTDNGLTWVANSRGMINFDVSSLVITPSGKLFAVITGPRDVVVSTNEGASWSEASGGKTLGARKLAVSPSGRVYVATARGVLHTTDDGASWELDTTGLTTRDIRTIGVDDRGYIFCSAGNGTLFRSTDGAFSWQTPASGLGSSTIQCYLFPSRGTIYVGTERHGVYRSQDNGGTWTQMNAGLTRELISALTYDAQYGYFCGSYGEIYRSTNEGALWNRITGDLPSGLINSIVVNNTGGADFREGLLTLGMEYRGVMWGSQAKWVPWNTSLWCANVSTLLRVGTGGSYKLIAATVGNGLFKSEFWPPVGIELPALASALTLDQSYPNPARATDAITIPFTAAMGATAELTVSTVLGQTLVRRQAAADERAFHLDPGTLPPGVYACTVRIAGDATTRMFCIQR